MRDVFRKKATIRVPSIGFTFKMDSLETSSSDFALMGTEANGKYYEARNGQFPHFSGPLATPSPCGTSQPPPSAR